MTHDVHIEPEARRWLESRPHTRGLVIDFDVHRCCGGGKICEVKVRPTTDEGPPREFVTGTTADGLSVSIDRRAAARLPQRFGLTVSGVGPWKHLDLRLEPEEWGDLLWA